MFHVKLNCLQARKFFKHDIHFIEHSEIVENLELCVERNYVPVTVQKRTINFFTT